VLLTRKRVENHLSCDKGFRNGAGARESGGPIRERDERIFKKRKGKTNIWGLSINERRHGEEDHRSEAGKKGVQERKEKKRGTQARIFSEFNGD